MITKQQFKELTGENPEDVLGNDWMNTISEISEDDFFCPRNNCGNPKSYGEATCGDDSSH